MANNFWRSSHYLNWCYDEVKPKELEENQKSFTTIETELIHRLMIKVIDDLCAFSCSNHPRLDSVIFLTAATYYRRFFLKNKFENFDPRLVATTCVYLAAKAEEYQIRLDTLIQGIKTIHFEYSSMECLNILNMEESHILECEFYIVHALDFELVLFSPFTVLEHLQDKTKDITLDDTDHIFQTAWSLCNEAAFSNILLNIPPFLIAGAAFYLSLIYNQYDADEIFMNLNYNNIKLDLSVKKMIEMLQDKCNYENMDYDEIIIQLDECVPYY